MVRRFMLRSARLGIILVATVALLDGSVAAADATTEVIIQEVTVDRDAGTLTIDGTGFDTKQDTTVVLGGIQLTILAETSTQVVAALPASIESGSYQLDVYVTGGTSRSDEFDLSIDDDEELQHQLDALTARLDTLEAENEQLQGQVASLTSLLAGASRVADPVTGVDTLTFSGINLQVVNGTGETERSMNGAGNLIVGYNAGSAADFSRTGSHNLVIGDWNEYTQWSGAVVGAGNWITGEYAVVLGGENNVASGDWSFIGGGGRNTASGDDSAIVGGNQATASGNASFIGGGEVNRATGIASFVGGGQVNVAGGNESAIVGGFQNNVSGQDSFIGGGRTGAVIGQYAAIVGGRTNTVTGSYSFAAAGSNLTTPNATGCGWITTTNVTAC